MARIRNGILGGYRGKLGNTIGQVYRGVEVVRTLPQSVYNPQTLEQQEHRKIFSELARILSGAVNCMQFSRLSREFQYNAYNEVFRSNWRNAVTNNEIDYQKLNFGTFWGAPLDNFTIDVFEGIGDFEKYYVADLAWFGCDNGVDAFEDDQIMIVCVVQPVNGFSYVCFSQFLQATRGKTDDKEGVQIPIIEKNRLAGGDIVQVYNGTSGRGFPRGKRNPKEVVNIPARYPQPNPPGYGASQQSTAPSGFNTLAWCYSYAVQ